MILVRVNDAAAVFAELKTRGILIKMSQDCTVCWQTVSV